MKKKLLTLLILSNFLFQSTSASATSTETISLNMEYPADQSKSFSNEDEFYNKLNDNIYQEYENAAFSIRQKFFLKDVPDAEYTFKQKTNRFSEKMNHLPTHIHPNRQVYFMASFHQNEKGEFHKYVVIDAETEVILFSGNSYHRYENPSK